MPEVMPETFDFDRPGLMLFTGASGSGKSTRMARLIAEHPVLRARVITPISGVPVDLTQESARTTILAIDELTRYRELVRIVLLLRRGHCIIAASHLNELLVKTWLWKWPLCAVRTDLDPGQIGGFLAERGVTYSDAAVEDFCQTFGASFIDAQLVLESCTARSFDDAWARFKRNGKIKRDFPVPLFGV